MPSVKRKITLIFLTIFGGLLSPTSAFLWDEYNIIRLFWNADSIFNDIITDVAEPDKLCVNQFKYFVEKLDEEWAVKCKLVLVNLKLFFFKFFIHTRQFWIRGERCPQDCFPEIMLILDIMISVSKLNIFPRYQKFRRSRRNIVS